MPSIEELGQLMKQQYPGKFDHRTGREIGLELKMKYPSRFLEYRDQSLIKKESTAIVPEVLPSSSRLSRMYNSPRNSLDRFSEELELIANVDHNLYSSLASNDGLRRNVESLIKYYEPSRGRFTSWWQRGKGEGRSKLLSVVNEEQRLLIEQAAMLERAAAEERRLQLEGKRQQVEFNIFIAQNSIALMELKSRANLIEQAFEAGMTVEDFSAINQEQVRSDIRATEYERKVLIDHQINTEEREQAIDLATRTTSLKEHYEINKLQKLIDDVQQEIQDIENDPNLSDVTKYSRIKDKEQTLKYYREDKRARQNRLLQNNNGQNI